MASLLDTNVLVYRYDPRDPDKQRRATEVLRRGIEQGDVCLAHQTLVEFVAAVTRPALFSDGERRQLLQPADAHREVDELLLSCWVLYPDAGVVRSAIRCAAAYQLSWWDAHLLAYADVNGLAEILSEDFQHGRIYGTVRVIDPFADLHPADRVNDPRAERPPG
ncbi:MAG: PIN domain-containing protein [Acidobacteriota bacterium]